MQTLILSEGKLDAGTYVLMVDAAWNTETANNAEYKNVHIDIYCPELVSIEAISTRHGIENFANASKTYANEKYKGEYFLKEKDIATQVVRVKQVYAYNNWYGFLYIRNDSEFFLNQLYQLKLQGLTVIYPEMKED